MSEELRDEVEAINSIYGDDTLVPAGEPLAYILTLPGKRSSLRLCFSEAYPSEPPAVLGTHHSSGGRKGSGARDLALFRDVLGSVFVPGAVCLFDALEDFARRLEEEEGHDEPEAQPQVPIAAQPPGHERDGRRNTAEEPSPQIDMPASDTSPPQWTLSELLVDTKSTFIAHVAPVTSPAQARQYVQQLLASDRRFRTATHNMTAWRIRGADGLVTYQDCDDDGETAAGSRLLHLMQLMDLWDVMVVVSRWYGGVKLGPRRFAVINAVARDAFVRAGMVHDKDKDKDKEKPKKKGR
ncbi:hypothetical protein S7711_01494 [Stachybotrys chartarum IBT 7711]|uniref:RWD domain-containing protein n=1 Tax=Stachybotrys chartarum (strain CBS 109288 / IBT 7711) TaxID=1280523 RepID=A0A084B752_STACB|nr:hypothetical protein S7711_01494 [Stachybotrys chartarum IBT 7711]KFA75561.1 hypothetical protein S40288_10115 [Stachybotrys chartarum IBT 40288]